MKVKDVVSFRSDLLFNGAVQISWFETNKEKAVNAAEHFVFHGPDYHGVQTADFGSSMQKVTDTASFTLDILKSLNEKQDKKNPFVLGIAGYGTGKSHLGVTLANLLSNLFHSDVSNKIIRNIEMADEVIGQAVKENLEKKQRPYLVVAINGMNDFDLSSEIYRQVIATIKNDGHDISGFNKLRPRFQAAINILESLFDSIRDEVKQEFGHEETDYLIDMLEKQDEDTYKKIAEIYELKTRQPMTIITQESLQAFFGFVKSEFCGDDKPYSGVVIIFDEFGRYMEFSVQKPHIAGSGALQQLFEAVQEHNEHVFLLCFIQYALNAYISRIAPELRSELNRYVTRYDAAAKYYLSTNLETLIANLLEKKDKDLMERHLENSRDSAIYIQTNMMNWFPEIKNNSLWSSEERFESTIYRGCWPLNPFSVWCLQKLSSNGIFQQRSALYLLDILFKENEEKEIIPDKLIAPVDLCNKEMIEEYISSEKPGQKVAIARAFEAVLGKHQYYFEPKHVNVMKAIMMIAKIGGIRVRSKAEYYKAINMFTNLDDKQVEETTNNLEKEFAVIQWNEQLNQYDILGDAAPRREFIEYLEESIRDIDSDAKSEIFSQNYKDWSGNVTFTTDFASENDITTSDWHYNIYYANVSSLDGVINQALSNWLAAKNPDDFKGQLIYCYVGPESEMEKIKDNSKEKLNQIMLNKECDLSKGAPVAIFILNDRNGEFGEKIAQYWVLDKDITDDLHSKYAHFVQDKKEQLWIDINDLFSVMEKERNFVFATNNEIEGGRIKQVLSNLFYSVYHKTLPFPVDGFGTARGNAAKDCAMFTKKLFLGTLDREAIAVFNVQQRNRAEELFNRGWGVLGAETIHYKTANSKVKEIMKIVEQSLEDIEDNQNKPMNMGAVVKQIMQPPYGCNMASAGLLIALYICCRKSELNLIMNGEYISFDNWLKKAMPSNFLDLKVLEKTDVIKVTMDDKSEWDKLLDDWEAENTYRGKLQYMEVAKELLNRVPVPQDKYYHYKHLNDKTEELEKKVLAIENIIYEANEKISKGEKLKDVGQLSWGAKNLVTLCEKIKEEGQFWENQTVQDIESDISHARLKIQEYFTDWLKEQNVASIEDLGKFKNYMLNKVGSNLEYLKMPQEKEKLNSHVKEIEENITFIEQIKQTANDINNMIQKNAVNDSITINTLNNWLSQVDEYNEKLEHARNRKYLVQDDLEIAFEKLQDFKIRCGEQLNKHKERMEALYNIVNINSKGEIEYWRQEVASLININEGNDKDIEDLKLVLGQISLLEDHYKYLDNDNVSNEELDTMMRSCITETDNEFKDDVPPLDAEAIYESIHEILKEKRSRAANSWMERNMADYHAINNGNASFVLDIKKRLQNSPRYLSKEQAQKVENMIEACEKRLDETELEGLIQKFISLSKKNKKIFYERISSHIN